MKSHRTLSVPVQVMACCLNKCIKPFLEPALTYHESANPIEWDTDSTLIQNGYGWMEADWRSLQNNVYLSTQDINSHVVFLKITHLKPQPCFPGANVIMWHFLHLTLQHLLAEHADDDPKLAATGKLILKWPPRKVSWYHHQGSTLRLSKLRFYFPFFSANFLIHWYLKMDNLVVSSGCPKAKSDWIWQADNP